MNHVAKKSAGFTLIELTIAMAFISFLLLAIALTVIQVGTIYNRGMMLKEVNMTSREISADFTRSIQTQGTIDISTDYVQITSGGIPIGGRLCLGSVSYVWNYGEALQRKTAGESIDVTVKQWDNKPVHIAKINDSERNYCKKIAGVLVIKNTIPNSDQAGTSEVLREGDRTLDIYQLDIISHPDAFDLLIGQRLYTLQYTIGSGNYTALNDTRTACKAPGEAGADIQYCTIEQFNVVVRVGSNGG